MEKTKPQVGEEVNFTSKKANFTGKVVKIYDENEKTYYKIKVDKKYYYKQLNKINNPQEQAAQ
jgi:hypothetical protein